MQKILIVLALLAGLIAAYVDALPKFDDSAVLAFGLLIVTGLVALVSARRPWLLALLAGVWIPLHDIPKDGNWGAILALVFAFIGAYLGWGARWMVRKMGTE